MQRLKLITKFKRCLFILVKVQIERKDIQEEKKWTKERDDRMRKKREKEVEKIGQG